VGSIPTVSTKYILGGFFIIVMKKHKISVWKLYALFFFGNFIFDDIIELPQFNTIFSRILFRRFSTFGKDDLTAKISNHFGFAKAW